MASAPQRKMILEPNGSEVSTAAGTARRYRKRLRDVRWPDIKPLLSDSLDQWSKHNAPRLGASLAFYSLLSLAPLLLVVVSIVGVVFGHSTAERDTIQQVRSLVGPAAGKAVAAFLQGSQNTTHGIIATVIGLVTLLFSASGVLIELRDALNLIWEVPTPGASGFAMITTFIKERLFSFAIVLAIGFLLIVSLVISTWISALGALSASVLPWETAAMGVVNGVVSFVVISGLFAAIYKIMPDVRLEWPDVLLGGAVTSLLFTLGKLVLGMYLGRASYASTYGAAASIVVLIAWVYYSAQIFFFGAELTKAFATRYGSQPQTRPPILPPAGAPAPDPTARIIVPED
ncbi:MAG: YihY/virulence factor BrkB family protein [Acidobacteriaceae bacterium]|nr:YihY/virulence factor BrkB family protein [Acidobacteriaceae bacterium]